MGLIADKLWEDAEFRKAHPQPDPTKVVASIRPLDGKYYGTKIQIEYGADEPIIINIWKSTGKLSKRQCEYWCIKEGQETEPEIRLSYLCDNHYESALTFMVADLLVNRLNNMSHNEVRDFAKML